MFIPCSPDNRALRSREEVLHYLTSAGTCKCGLRCPFMLDDVFNFDPNLIGLPDNIPFTSNSLCSVKPHLTLHKVKRRPPTQKSQSKPKPFSSSKSIKRAAVVSPPFSLPPPPPPPRSTSKVSKPTDPKTTPITNLVGPSPRTSSPAASIVHTNVSYPVLNLHALVSHITTATSTKSNTTTSPSISLPWLMNAIQKQRSVSPSSVPTSSASSSPGGSNSLSQILLVSSPAPKLSAPLLTSSPSSVSSLAKKKLLPKKPAQSSTEVFPPSVTSTCASTGNTLSIDAIPNSLPDMNYSRSLSRSLSSSPAVEMINDSLKNNDSNSLERMDITGGNTSDSSGPFTADKDGVIDKNSVSDLEGGAYLQKVEKVANEFFRSQQNKNNNSPGTCEGHDPVPSCSLLLVGQPPQGPTAPPTTSLEYPNVPPNAAPPVSEGYWTQESFLGNDDDLSSNVNEELRNGGQPSISVREEEEDAIPLQEVTMNNTDYEDCTLREKVPRSGNVCESLLHTLGHDDMKEQVERAQVNEEEEEEEEGKSLVSATGELPCEEGGTLSQVDKEDSIVVTGQEYLKGIDTTNNNNEETGANEKDTQQCQPEQLLEDMDTVPIHLIENTCCMQPSLDSAGEGNNYQNKAVEKATLEDEPSVTKETITASSEVKDSIPHSLKETETVLDEAPLDNKTRKERERKGKEHDPKTNPTPKPDEEDNLGPLSVENEEQKPVPPVNYDIEIDFITEEDDNVTSSDQEDTYYPGTELLTFSRDYHLRGSATPPIDTPPVAIEAKTGKKGKKTGRADGTSSRKRKSSGNPKSRSVPSSSRASSSETIHSGEGKGRGKRRRCEHDSVRWSTRRIPKRHCKEVQVGEREAISGNGGSPDSVFSGTQSSTDIPLLGTPSSSSTGDKDDDQTGPHCSIVARKRMRSTSDNESEESCLVEDTPSVSQHTKGSKERLIVSISRKTLPMVTSYYTIRCYPFVIGDIVWARARQLPYWPGKIISHKDWKQHKLKPAPKAQVGIIFCDV